MAVAGGTTTLQLGCDVVDSGYFQNVMSSDVEEKFVRKSSDHPVPAEGWCFRPQHRFAPKNVSLVDKN